MYQSTTNCSILWLHPSRHYLRVRSNEFYKRRMSTTAKKISPILYNSFRVHRHASRIPLYTPKSLGGYGVINIYHLQGYEKTKFYIMHRRRRDTTGQLLQIGTRYTQFELGTSTPFWNLRYAQYKFFITETWITHIWYYLDSCSTKLIEIDFWNYKLPRINDFYIMHIVHSTNLSTEQKQMFNQTRMYMKIISASDLIDDKTGILKDNVLGCRKPMTSRYGFPYIKKFPKSWLVLWDSIIMSIILPKIQSLPLGPHVAQSHLDITENAIYTNQLKKNTFYLKPNEIAPTSPKFAVALQRIQNAIQWSPRWKRHICGKSTLNPRSLYQILKLATIKKLAIATDASVDNGNAAHGFCFADRRKGKVIFSSGSKVEGPARHLTSYRAEMVSIIAAMELVDTILSSVGIDSLYIPLYTDSEASITASKNTKLNTLHYVLSNDIDVTLQLHESLQTCKQRVSLIHVPGHQDKHKKFHELEIPAQLNVLMDGLSKKIVVDTKNDSNKIIPFPAQALFLFTDRPIAHDI